MKVKYENVISIQDVGVFRKTNKTMWGFIQYDRIDGDGFFVSKSETGEFAFMFDIIGTLNKEIEVAFCSKNLMESFLKFFRNEN